MTETTMIKNVDLTLVEKVVKDHQGSVDELNKSLKKIASVKCRLKKQKSKPSYQEEMSRVLQEEQLLKEAKQLVQPKKITTTTMTKEYIDQLDYDETMKALRSIQSKKSNTKYDPDSQSEFENACQIEKLLKEHRKLVRPIDDRSVRKSDIQTIIDTIESNDKLSNKKIVELLQELI